MSESLCSTRTYKKNVVQIIYCDYDVKGILLYENQEGNWRDLELVERIWKMKPDIESPETFIEPPALATVNDTVVCLPKNKPVVISSSKSLATPRVIKCFAPKNRKINLKYENLNKLIPLLI